MSWKAVTLALGIITGFPAVVTGLDAWTAAFVFWNDLQGLVELYRDGEQRAAWDAWVRHHKAGTIERIWEKLEAPNG